MKRKTVYIISRWSSRTGVRSSPYRDQQVAKEILETEITLFNGWFRYVPQSAFGTTQPPSLQITNIQSLVSNLSYSQFPTTDSNSTESPKSQNQYCATHLPIPVQTTDPQESRLLRLHLSRPSG